MNSLDEITQRLHTAVKDGDTELTLSLIEQGASVNNEDSSGDQPLNIALTCGCTELALSLIKHGASVNQTDMHGSLPITWYVYKDLKHSNDEIFTRLIPGDSMNILKTICQILSYSEPTDPGSEHKLEVLSSRLHKLIQHLIAVETLCINFRHGISDFKIRLNQHLITSCAPLRAVYLCSVLLILLGCNVSYVDEIASSLRTSRTTAEYLKQAYVIDDLWNTYKQKTGVRKLQALWIQKTRQSMHSLSDESFQSLPIPPHLQNRLMLQDIADVLFEGYKMWPKFIPNEKLM